MRNIKAGAISDLIAELCVKANIKLRKDILRAIRAAIKKEPRGHAKKRLKMLIDNAGIAAKNEIPICQDTGMAVVFVEIGQDIHVTSGSLKDAVDKGVERAYREGYFRKSVVQCPIKRKNTGTNTPVILYTTITPGDTFRVWVMAKGFGSENKSAIKMLCPTAGEEEIIDFILDTVKNAGAEACPPLVIGIGIGGTFDYAAHLSKKSILRDIGKKNPQKRLAVLEKKIMKKVNKLGIGPMGLGGRTTALGVTVLSSATHIAGLPVAVNISCHATRSAYGRL